MTYGGDEAGSGCTRPLGFESGRFERLFLGLLLTDIAEDCYDILVCFFTSGRRAFQRSAPHLDPDKLAGASRSDIPQDTKFERAHVTRTRRIGKCGQIGRPIGNMHALEKFFACKFSDGVPNSGSASGEAK